MTRVRTTAVGLLAMLALSACGASATADAPSPNGAATARSASCHARGRGAYALPDPRCTPGAVDPAVSPATIHQTICRRGWTARIRPPESVTEPEKAASMAAYGDTGSRHGYEYDHLIPLELGGAVNDRHNLWPEPAPSPNLKDRVENALRRAVCAGRMALRVAQRDIARDWVALIRPHHLIPGP